MIQGTVALGSFESCRLSQDGAREAMGEEPGPAALRRTPFYACMYVCMYVFLYVCTYYVGMYACMHACMHACMYVCMYVCMCACASSYSPQALGCYLAQTTVSIVSTRRLQVGISEAFMLKHRRSVGCISSCTVLSSTGINWVPDG